MNPLVKMLLRLVLPSLLGAGLGAAGTYLGMDLYGALCTGNPVEQEAK